MTLRPPAITPSRHKVVWGPKRTLASLFLVAFSFGVVTTASAAGSGQSRHHQKVSTKRPGAPGFNVKNYKQDDEVAKRADRGNPLFTSSVIVTLVPGAQLPPEFKKFARADKLDIINGQVLDLPNGVLKQLAKHPDIFRNASPIARVHADAPPFLVIHGTGDSVIPVEQARSFVEGLRAASHSVVSYVELPGAGHAFDMIDGARTGSMATAIGLFLNQIHRNRSLNRAKAVI